MRNQLSLGRQTFCLLIGTVDSCPYLGSKTLLSYARDARNIVTGKQIGRAHV